MSDTIANKRKIESDSEDEDVQLFLKSENEILKKIKTDTPKTPAQSTKKLDSTNSAKTKDISTPKSIQTKLPFKSIQPNVANKVTNCAPTKIEVDKSETHDTIVNRPDGEWFIEDYLLDREWKSLLKEEFEKKYFIEINKIIKEGYKKNILRPPKELVFNALNSTPLKQVCKILRIKRILNVDLSD